MGGDAYEAGVEVAASFQKLDGPNVNPMCHTRLYSHGHRTERSLVLLHGFTAGLGERLTVAGLSLGGTLTGLLAQERESVERAVLIAPMLGLQRIPGPAHPVLAELAYVLPNFWIWWDSNLKDKIEPVHGYPRFSTHAYAALFKTATRVLKAAQRTAPKAGSISVVTNAAEPGLENRFTYQLVDRWRRHGAAVSTFEFPASDRLPHDLIDPANPAQNTKLVYPVVIKAILND